MNPKIQELVETLQGTCKAFFEGCNDAGIDEDELTDEDYTYLDNEIFRCDTCGWWYEISNMGTGDGEAICRECEEE